MKRTLLRLLLPALVIAGALARADVAVALPVFDRLSVFDQSGAVFASVSLSEREALLDPTRIVFIDRAGLADPAQLGNSTTVLGPGGTFLDVFGVADIGAGPVLAFNTFNPGSPFGAQSALFVPLGNGTFDATMYLSPTFRDAGFSAEFAAVPLPGTLPLMGVCLIAVVLVGGAAKARRSMT